MRVMRMSGLMLGLLLAAVALAATAAQAAEGPFYKIAGKRLTAGETHEIKAKASKPFTFKAGTLGLECTEQKLTAGSKLVGSTGANPGGGEGAAEFSGCAVTGNGEHCEVVSHKITTQVLEKVLVYSNGSATGVILLELVPVTSTTFSFISFSGAECIVKEVKVEGSIAAETLSGEKPVEVGKEPAEAKTVEANFPSTAIKAVWREKAGKLEEKKVGLKAFGGEAKLGGRSQLTLVGEPSWGIFT
jgi:hypothetical protein